MKHLFQGYQWLKGLFSALTQTCKNIGNKLTMKEFLNQIQDSQNQQQPEGNNQFAEDMQENNIVNVMDNKDQPIVEQQIDLNNDIQVKKEIEILSDSGEEGEQKQVIFQVPSLSQSVSTVTQNLIENQRAVNFEYKYYIRERVNKTELQQNYQIKNLQIKKDLSNHCDAMIPVRGDGNCFYSSFGYQFLKFLINDREYLQEIQEKYSNVEMKIIKDDKTIIEEDKYEKLRKNFFERIDYFSQIKDQNEREKQFEIHFAAFEKNEQSDGFLNTLTVVFLRNLSYFLVEQSVLKDVIYDKCNLLIWEQACNYNEPIIALLSKKLNLKIKLIFFEQQTFTLLEYNPKFEKRTVILLIKPGHYNIGIKY